MYNFVTSKVKRAHGKEGGVGEKPLYLIGIDIP